MLGVAMAIGVVVGLTGMGGGALMTPALVLVFGVPPLTAVSSDIVASAAMKPAASWVHVRRRTVDWRLVRLLVVGSVPAAFSGVLLARWLAPGPALQDVVKSALGAVLILASLALAARAYVQLLERARRRDHPEAPRRDAQHGVKVRPVPTVIVGMVGGLMVGLTSVGSGSLIVVALIALYPALTASRLVGTDLVQAVPLVLAAGVGHLLFGDVDWSIAIPIMLGSIPGAVVGAYLSSRVGGGLVRRALMFVLLAAGMKLLDVSTTVTLAVLASAAIGGTAAWAAVRRSLGFPAFGRQERDTSAREDG